jgi:hypothetical protein
MTDPKACSECGSVDECNEAEWEHRWPNRPKWLRRRLSETTLHRSRQTSD